MWSSLFLYDIYFVKLSYSFYLAVTSWTVRNILCVTFFSEDEESLADHGMARKFTMNKTTLQNIQQLYKVYTCAVTLRHARAHVRLVRAWIWEILYEIFFGDKVLSCEYKSHKDLSFRWGVFALFVTWYNSELIFLVFFSSWLIANFWPKIFIFLQHHLPNLIT